MSELVTDVAFGKLNSRDIEFVLYHVGKAFSDAQEGDLPVLE